MEQPAAYVKLYMKLASEVDTSEKEEAERLEDKRNQAR